MKVVGHETKAVNLPGGFAAGFGQGRKKQQAIVLVGEDGLFRSNSVEALRKVRRVRIVKSLLE